MAEVISLEQSRLEREAHLTGPAKCMDCKHTWIATAPIGRVALECPECGTHRGVWRGHMTPENSEVLVCQCSNDTYIVMRTGIMCVSCGIITAFEDLCT